MPDELDGGTENPEPEEPEDDLSTGDGRDDDESDDDPDPDLNDQLRPFGKQPNALSGLNAANLFPHLDFSSWMPKFDFWSSIVPKDYGSSIVPKAFKIKLHPDQFKWRNPANLSGPDTARILPKYDLSSIIPPFDPSLFGPRFDSSSLFASFKPPSFEIFSPELREAIESLLAGVYPPNWPSKEEGASKRQVIDWISETGWPIVWVPRSSIVLSLIEATADEHDTVFLAAAAEILDDCQDAIGDVQGDVVGNLAPYASEIVAVMSNGHHAAAQSLAATVISSVLQDRLGWSNFTDARIKLDIDVNTLPAWKARILIILGCIPGVLAAFRPHRGDPVPETFNRHASAHIADSAQFTERNALLATVFVVAMLREIEELERRDLWKAFLLGEDGVGPGGK